MKTNPGNYFEDFALGLEIHHATPRTVTLGDVALYQALTGSRFAVQSSDEMARAVGYRAMPLDDFLVFNVVFGKTVPDVSLNAIANLGYADVRFGEAVYAGDTLRAQTRIIGLKENSNGRTGVVYVRSQGRNERGATVLEFTRWVMVRKREPGNAGDAAAVVPELPAAVEATALSGLGSGQKFHRDAYDFTAAGSKNLWGDYAVGERIDHLDAMTIEEAEHQMATRLYQNTAKVHFNLHQQKDSRFGRRLIYGGHVISLARALSFNGLENAFRVAAINAGAHVAPCFAGDTVYAWSEVLDKAPLADEGLGALRLRTIATKDRSCNDFPTKTSDGYEEGVVLDLDYWVVLPR